MLDPVNIEHLFSPPFPGEFVCDRCPLEGSVNAKGSVSNSFPTFSNVSCNKLMIVIY